jgi:diguanylate cyclase (GGDEF)-like protein
MIGQNTLFNKAFIYIFVFFVAIMGLFGVVIHKMTAQAMKEQMGNRCKGIASAVAVLIEENADQYKKFIKTLDTDSAYYRKMASALQKIREYNEGSIVFLYTEIQKSDTEMMYILDGGKPGTPGFSPPGSTDELSASGRQAYATQSVFVEDYFTSKWGTLLSAYVPIHDKTTGEFLGLVGVDVSINQYNDVMNYQLAIIVASIVVLLLMVALTLVLSSERVERMIFTDGLTGVYTKSYFMHTLKNHVKSAQKKDIPVTVFMADLDHFKKVNDTYGHPFGDTTLKTISRVVASALRKTDCLARYGGEEFVAFLPGMDIIKARRVIDRIRESVEATPISAKDTTIHITISIGVTQFVPGQTPADIIEKADKALYSAKMTRNTVAYYSETETNGSPVKDPAV